MQTVMFARGTTLEEKTEVNCLGIAFKLWDILRDKVARWCTSFTNCNQKFHQPRICLHLWLSDQVQSPCCTLHPSCSAFKVPRQGSSKVKVGLESQADLDFIWQRKTFVWLFYFFLFAALLLFWVVWRSDFSAICWGFRTRWMSWKSKL